MADRQKLLTQYERGEWELFSLITSAWYGEECYFLESDLKVWSRLTGKRMTREEAIDEFIRGITEYD